MSYSNTTSQTREPSTRIKNTITRITMDQICQRCFLRLAHDPDHICYRIPGFKCWYCQLQGGVCISLPDEFVQEAEEAMNGSIAELEAKVWKIRQKIIMRTRGLNIKKRDVVPMFHQIKNEITAEFGIEVEAADVLIMSCLNEAADAAEAYMQ